MMRVRADVVGELYDYAARTWHVLDHAADWADDHPIVVAYPDVFEPVPKAKTAKKEG